MASLFCFFLFTPDEMMVGTTSVMPVHYFQVCAVCIISGAESQYSSLLFAAQVAVNKAETPWIMFWVTTVSCGAKQSPVSCGHGDEHLVFPQQEIWSCPHRSSSMSRSAAHVPALVYVSHCCGAASINFSQTQKIKSSSFPIFILLWRPHNQPYLSKDTQ